MWPAFRHAFTALALLMDPNPARQAFPDDARMARLAEAVAAGDSGAIARLAPGVDPDTRGDQGVNLLQWAILNRQLAGMQALLDLGADPLAAGLAGNSAVHVAAAEDPPDYLAALLEHGVDPRTAHPASGRTPLHAAAIAGRMENIRALLAAGANLDARDRDGNTPLHFAGSAGDTKLVLLLLDAGADPGLHNRTGHTFDDFLFGMSEEFLDQATRAELQRIRRRVDARRAAGTD